MDETTADDLNATTFALGFVVREMERDRTDPLPSGGERHLVLGHAEDAAARREMRVQVACATEYVPFNRTRHTFLTAATTCPACIAVNTARIVLLDAGEKR